MYTILFFIAWIKHLRYNHILKNTYKEDDIIKKLTLALEAPIHIDWIGRLYTVLNPLIKKGKYEPSQIVEYDFNGNPDDTQWMTQWIMTRLNIIKRFIMTENLFELLTYKIKKIDQYYNYLLIIQPITLLNVCKRLKQAGIEISVIIVLIIICFLIF